MEKLTWNEEEEVPGVYEPVNTIPFQWTGQNWLRDGKSNVLSRKAFQEKSSFKAARKPSLNMQTGGKSMVSDVLILHIEKTRHRSC